MEEFDAFRDRLRRNKLSFVWLIHQLEKRNVVTEKTELSSIFSGTRKGAKAEAVAQTSSAILDEYEKSFLHEK